MNNRVTNSNPKSVGARFWVVSIKAASLLLAAFIGLAVGRFGGTALFSTINPPESTIPSVTPVPAPPVEMEPVPPPVPQPRVPDDDTRKEESIEEMLKQEALRELRKRIEQAEREIRKRTGIDKGNRKVGKDKKGG